MDDGSPLKCCPNHASSCDSSKRSGSQCVALFSIRSKAMRAPRSPNGTRKNTTHRISSARRAKKSDFMVRYTKRPTGRHPLTVSHLFPRRPRRTLDSWSPRTSAPDAETTRRTGSQGKLRSLLRVSASPIRVYGKPGTSRQGQRAVSAGIPRTADRTTDTVAKSCSGCLNRGLSPVAASAAVLCLQRGGSVESRRPLREARVLADPGRSQAGLVPCRIPVA